MKTLRFPAFAALLALCISPASPSRPTLASLADRPAPSTAESAAVPGLRAFQRAVAPAASPSADRGNPAGADSQIHVPPGRDEIESAARKGLLDSALRLCRQAAAADPENPFLLLMLGKLSPDGKSSSEYFKQAIRAGGTSPEAEESIFRLGQFHYAAGKYHLAIPQFRDYLRMFPAGDWSDPAHYWMGNACLSLAQSKPDRSAYLDSGEAYFDRLLEKQKPEQYYHALALVGLAKARAAKGDRQGAWKAAGAALESAPQEERAPLLLLAAQIRQGVDRAEEKRLMARLSKTYPQSPEARYLRKLNAGADTSRWKSGPGLPRAATPTADALAAQVDSILTAPETPPPSDRVVKTAGEFTLQVGAFSQAANANAMFSNLSKLGFAPELVEIRRSGKPVYQVRLGRFTNSGEASDYARTHLKPHRLLAQPIQLSP